MADKNSTKIKHKVYTRHNGGDPPENAYRSLIKKSVRATLQIEAVDIICVVNVLITDDEGIRCYNRDYRSVDGSTDVLSFPMQEFQHSGWDAQSDFELDEDTGELPLGDIIISMESAKRQANDYGNTFEYEIAYLIIHSTLHLIGYDHDKKSSEKDMHKKNKSIMQEMGFKTNDK